MTELPLVVVDVQRGGPSTGLPTKTEQSDLQQALYGRNGESPVAVIAASMPSDCFHYAFEAGRIAMEHMTPVVLLSDGFIANGSEPWKIPSMKDYPTINPPIIDKTEDGGPFMPYARNEKLARSWAFPGKAGLEHRVGGLEKDKLKGSISTDAQNHQEMTNLRAAKVAKIADYIPHQTVYGDPEGDLLVVGWGGTRGHLQNAVDKMRAEGKKVSLCHFNYINPLPHGVADIFKGNSQNVEVSYSVPALTRTIRPAFTPDWFQNTPEGIIWLDGNFPIDAGQTLEGFLRDSLKAYAQSNFVSFVAFDSTGMSALQQVERFSSGAPVVRVYYKDVSPTVNTKLRVGVCHKTVEGREYCLVVVVRAR